MEELKRALLNLMELKRPQIHSGVKGERIKRKGMHPEESKTRKKDMLINLSGLAAGIGMSKQNLWLKLNGKGKFTIKQLRELDDFATAIFEHARDIASLANEIHINQRKNKQ